LLGRTAEAADHVIKAAGGMNSFSSVISFPTVAGQNLNLLFGVAIESEEL
jgi:hypothetical protein